MLDNRGKDVGIDVEDRIKIEAAIFNLVELEFYAFKQPGTTQPGTTINDTFTEVSGKLDEMMSGALDDLQANDTLMLNETFTNDVVEEIINTFYYQQLAKEMPTEFTS